MPWVSPEFSYPEVPSFMEPVGASNSIKFDHRRTAENSARLAFCMGTFVTTGEGYFVMPEAFVFDCLFIGEPYVFTGYYAPGYGTSVPQAFGCVVEYHYDSRNLYSSAHLGFNVNDFESYKPITHYFMFAGIGMKRLPQLKA